MYGVYILDDEPLALEDLCNNIPWYDNGFHILGKNTNPLKAIEEIQFLKPHVVLTDIKMPAMNGIEVIKALKDKGVGALFVVISAYSDFDLMRQVIHLKGFDYLLKPVDENSYAHLFSRLLPQLDSERRIPHPSPSTTSDELNRILRYLDANIDKDHSLEDISERFHISQSHICNLFRQHMDTTFLSYITKNRMELASTLLTDTNKTIKEIALLSGYDNYFYFCRVFRNYFDCTPTQYRQKKECLHG